VDFPNYSTEELMSITHGMLARLGYRLSPAGEAAFGAYIERRMTQPSFSNARSMRNAIDRARLRQADRLFRTGGLVTRGDLETLEADDVLRSRVFQDVS
jgi:hypothetical protein